MLAMLRRDEAERMRSLVTVATLGEPEWDPDAGEYVESVDELHYAGRASIRPLEFHTVTVVAGEGEVSLAKMRVTLEGDPDVPRGAAVDVDAAGADSALEGKRLVVDDVEFDDRLRNRVLICEQQN